MATSAPRSGETIQLLKPGDIDDAGTRYWIEVESITYSDGSHPEAFDDGRKTGRKLVEHARATSVAQPALMDRPVSARL